MPDLEKAIQWLEIERECVSRDCDRDCGKCDLAQDRETLLSACDDAISLLKAQQPRVMTLEEAKNADHCFCEAGSLFVCRIVPVPDGWVTIQQFGRPDMEIDSNEYGIAFRCWTSTPSKEQMEATPWL